MRLARMSSYDSWLYIVTAGRKSWGAIQYSLEKYLEKYLKKYLENYLDSTVKEVPLPVLSGHFQFNRLQMHLRSVLKTS